MYLLLSGNKLGEIMEMNVSLSVKEKGKKIIYVQFTEGKLSAEGVYPECKIIKNEGFTADEVGALENYMKENGKTIEELSKSVNIWKAFSG